MDDPSQEKRMSKGCSTDRKSRMWDRSGRSRLPAAVCRTRIYAHAGLPIRELEHERFLWRSRFVNDVSVMLGLQVPRVALTEVSDDPDGMYPLESPFLPTLDPSQALLDATQGECNPATSSDEEDILISCQVQLQTAIRSVDEDLNGNTIGIVRASRQAGLLPLVFLIVRFHRMLRELVDSSSPTTCDFGIKRDPPCGARRRTCVCDGQWMAFENDPFR